MINLELDYRELAFVAATRNEPILRVLFDDHIYKHIPKVAFESASRSHNNCIVQIDDHGLDHIGVRIKTEGVHERIGT